MTIDARLGVACTMLLLVCGVTLPAGARADTDSCSLLTPKDVSAAVGVQVGDGTHVTATAVKTCTWSPSGNSDVRAVTLFLQPAASFDGGKQMASQVAAAVKGGAVTPASVGDDAYFFVAGEQVELFVKKGANSFKTTVYAKLPVDKKEAMELALAKQVVTKI